jgi:hypothetical protein
MTYTITVINGQGASDQFTGDTRSEMGDYLAAWADPQSLTAIVRDDDGNVVAEKPLQRKTILWQVGRPAVVKDGKAITVYLDADSLQRAADRGNGNVSEGIRQALKQPL